MTDREQRLAASLDVVKAVAGPQPLVLDRTCSTGTISRRLLQSFPGTDRSPSTSTRRSSPTESIKDQGRNRHKETFVAATTTGRAIPITSDGGPGCRGGASRPRGLAGGRRVAWAPSQRCRGGGGGASVRRDGPRPAVPGPERPRPPRDSVNPGPAGAGTSIVPAPKLATHHVGARNREVVPLAEGIQCVTADRPARWNLAAATLSLAPLDQQRWTTSVRLPSLQEVTRVRHAAFSVSIRGFSELHAQRSWDDR
jgi:hypothetical protein